MKKIIYPIFALLLLLTASCKDEFFDINENPNAPTAGSITPQLILPRTQHAVAARMATSYDYAAHWMGYWARSGTYGPSAEQETYNITTNYQQDEWTGWYDILTDVDLMEKKATASGENFYASSAKLLKAIGFMYLVDQYNDVPYSQAFNITENLLPAYDKGSVIYADLLLQLDAAAKLMKDATITPEMYEADILFGKKGGAAFSEARGETQKLMWRKLINTQRLKLLLRQSEIFGNTVPAAEIAKITADGAGFLMSGQTAEVQPGYGPTADQDNPFYATYKVSATGSRDDYNRASNYVLNKFRNNNDIRFQYFFSQAATPIGTNTYYGYNFGEIIPNNAPNAANSSDVAGPGLAKGPSQPQWLFTSVESMFLQAEAIQRGWLPGDAKAAYENAVKESFTWLGVPNAATVAATYLAQENPMISWTANTTAAAKIRLIVMQKYLALVGINNFEAWVDYRRVGVPTDLPLSLSPNRNNNTIPLRLRYPQVEYNYNNANVAAQGAIEPQSTKVFWDVN